MRKVTRKDHSRYKTLRLNELEDNVLQLFDDEQWRAFVANTHKALPRYYRDQLSLALKKFTKVDDLGIFQLAVSYCLENKTYGIKVLSDTYKYLLKEHEEEQQIIFKAFSKIPLMVNRASTVNVPKRPVDTYAIDKEGAAV